MSHGRWDLLLHGGALATLDGDAGYGIVEDGVVGCRDGRIDFVGTSSDLTAAPNERRRLQKRKTDGFAGAIRTMSRIPGWVSVSAADTAP